MKTLKKSKNEKGLWLEEDKIPLPKAHEVLIKVKKTAVCGTDLHIFNWDEWSKKTVPVPLITGHEFFGNIESLGSEVQGLKIWDRVSGEGHITCGYCRNCRAGKQHLCRNTQGVGVNRSGCFAEYFTLPASNVFKIPDEIPDEVAAIFDPFGNAVHTALSFDLTGEDVLITGAGPIGIMAAAVASHIGARNVVITDVNDYRLDLAKKLARVTTVNPLKENLTDTMSRIKMVEGFDVGLEMSGNDLAFNNLLEVMNNGGKIALLGIFPTSINVDFSKIIFKGLTLKGIYGREMYETWYKMTALIQGGLDISPIITHSFPVEDYLKAFEIMNEGKAGKVILEW